MFPTGSGAAESTRGSDNMDISRIDRGITTAGKYENVGRESVDRVKLSSGSPNNMGSAPISSPGYKKPDASAVASQIVKEQLKAEVPAEKINRLRDLVQSGNYNVSAAQIANAMMYGMSGD